MKFALVDSVDHAPSLFAAVVGDDTQFQAVCKSHRVATALASN